MNTLEMLNLMTKAAADPTTENRARLVELFNNSIIGCYASDLYDELEDNNEYEILQTLEDAFYAARMNILYT